MSFPRNALEQKRRGKRHVDGDVLCTNDDDDNVDHKCICTYIISSTRYTVETSNKRRIIYFSIFFNKCMYRFTATNSF